MSFKTKNKSHDEIMKELVIKYKTTKAKQEERKLKFAIIKLYSPFRIKIKFSKMIVLLSITAIISYTIMAVLLQKYTLMEPIPTLTTCVYTFFGTELLSLAGIKICDTKHINHKISANDSIMTSTQTEEDAVG